MTALEGELAAVLGEALEAVAVLRLVSRELAARPGAERAERALLRLAIRHGLDLGPAPPFTAERRGLWRCWTRHADVRGARARWQAVRAAFAPLTPGARREVELVDGQVDELAWAELDVLHHEAEQLVELRRAG